MALTLLEMAKIEEAPLRRGVISVFLYESNIMQMIPWEDSGALSVTVIRFKTLPTVAFRMLNEAYAESTGTFEQIQESVYALGGDIDVDVVFVQNKAAVASPRATQTEMKLKSLAYKFNDAFINGDQALDPRSFDGIKKRISNMPSQQTITDTRTTNGLDVIANTANQHALVDLLDILCYAVDGHMPDALLMNRQMLLRFRSVLRRLGLLNVTEDQFGRMIDHYANIPLYDVGVQSDQATQIIGNAETQGTATDCTSVYAAKFGSEAYLGGLQEYALRVTDFGELETKPVYRTRVDWVIGLATWHPRCVARLPGLRANT